MAPRNHRAKPVPAQSLLILKPNRRLLAGIIVGSSALVLAGMVLTVSGVVDVEYQSLLLGGPAGALGVGILALRRQNRFAYDTRSRSFVLISRKDFRSAYRRSGLDRFEYVEAENRIYAVHSDGHRWRFPNPAWCYDRHDWEAVVGQIPRSTS